MPIGIITDVCATFLGACTGLLIGNKLPENLKTALNDILGIAAVTMGIVLILKNNTLPAVVLSVIIGCVVGELLQLEKNINKVISTVMERLMHHTDVDETFFIQVSAVVVLFCFSGTGWYGALNEGLTGDGSILVTKSILDFVTALIFGTVMGRIVPVLCIPQALVFGILYLASGLVQPFITPEMMGDFSAAGGIITLCAGLRLAGIKKDIRILNLLPALLFAFFVSALWTGIIG